ncbi:hypothetical protein LX32DRAFT_340338 [Colletotrichum zoysiae]|uniref:Uncharacterized protein n=1 Tax=Colletotrichum zoysiae TaxID=1216348 RepID=A0AAD9M7F7_9PEZI|nr:hypothetical protein LX32DRAFT_340338 [Colletotrichum zoysiae]
MPSTANPHHQPNPPYSSPFLVISLSLPQPTSAPSMPCYNVLRNLWPSPYHRQAHCTLYVPTHATVPALPTYPVPSCSAKSANAGGGGGGGVANRACRHHPHHGTARKGGGSFMLKCSNVHAALFTTPAARPSDPSYSAKEKYREWKKSATRWEGANKPKEKERKKKHKHNNKISLIIPELTLIRPPFSL